MDLIYRKKPDCYGRWYRGRMCMCTGTDKIFCEIETGKRNYENQKV